MGNSRISKDEKCKIHSLNQKIKKLSDEKNALLQDYFELKDYSLELEHKLEDLDQKYDAVIDAYGELQELYEDMKEKTNY